MSGRLLATAVLALVASTGCAQTSRLFQPAPERDWKSTLAEARAAADSGRWAVADQRLSQYVMRYPDRREAREAVYWRGLFRMAPGNDTTAHRLAIPTIEQYLAQPGGEHRTEAWILLGLAKDRAELRRLADAREKELAEVQAALGRAQRTTAPGATEQPADRGLAQEVERLKGELAKANQELERIRRRLAGQRP